MRIHATDQAGWVVVVICTIYGQFTLNNGRTQGQLLIKPRKFVAAQAHAATPYLLTILLLHVASWLEKYLVGAGGSRERGWEGRHVSRSVRPATWLNELIEESGKKFSTLSRLFNIARSNTDSNWMITLVSIYTRKYYRWTVGSTKRWTIRLTN